MGNTQPTPPSGELRAKGTLDIKDSRTDKSYSIQILEGGVEGDTATRAMDLRQIKTSPEEFGLMTSMRVMALSSGYRPHGAGSSPRSSRRW